MDDPFLQALFFLYENTQFFFISGEGGRGENLMGWKICSIQWQKIAPILKLRGYLIKGL